LALIDIVYYLRGVISFVYLLDAGLEVIFFLIWILELVRYLKRQNET
jgi:hypothetical protein